MIPGSRIWYKINKRTDTPIIAVWLFCICCVLINLIGLGSYTAISAIFNLTAIALDWSYCIPIVCKLAYGKFERGPFHLGKFSVPINVWAIVRNTFVTIIYVMPTIRRPETPQNVSNSNDLLLASSIHNVSQMNSFFVLISAVTIFSIGYWYAAGRYYYICPRINAQLIMGVEGEGKAGSSGDSSDEKRVVQ